MKANKTPIQELIETVFRVNTNRGVLTKSMLDDFIFLLESSLQKEKQFAFDCFSDGIHYGINRMMDGRTDSIEERFEQFYSQFANHE